jgi:hypothetical protein
VERSGSGKLWRDEISAGDTYVLHSKELVLFPEATEGFSRALAASAHPVRRTQFPEQGGTPYAEVVEVLRQTGSLSTFEGRSPVVHQLLQRCLDQPALLAMGRRWKQSTICRLIKFGR